MKKSIICKIEDLLSAMVNGVTGKGLKDIMRRPIVENKTTKNQTAKVPFKLLQLIK